ncbi:MAG: DoxX family protein [Acidimicrobiales bacterium]|jgi:thiosulfate dehydrogenase [quinone] large subunit
MFNIFRNNKIIEEAPPARWLFSSKPASIIWLVVRIFVGEQWISAGVSKLWGAENPSFWNNGGVGLVGFAKGAIAQSKGPYAQVHYNWWVNFLHNFVIPNAGWIAKLVSLGEFAIGCAICLGLFTGLAAFAGIVLNFTYVFSGAVSSNPVLIILSMLLVLAWRNAGFIGADGFLLPALGTPWDPGKVFARFRHTPVPAQIHHGGASA